ncbi:small ribosomal subunit protein bS18m-like [Oscarella lobularis]|uniref:small ribosomal subunit protein bS18m-like n=1 Tax=Oscarella lobularis TaxID=121494 RepID=UPI003313A144
MSSLLFPRRLYSFTPVLQGYSRGHKLPSHRSREGLEEISSVSIRNDGIRPVPTINACPTDCVCSSGVEFSHKNVRLLSQFVSPHTGMILGRRITGLCGIQQRKLAKTIKRARQMGLMPFTIKMPQYQRDPKLF